MGLQKRDLRKKLVKTVGTFSLLIFLIGCSGLWKTVYVPHGDAVRLRETVKNVKVWVKTKNGDIVPGKMDLPEGWYCLPLEDEDDS
jgi:hypothetical protein